MGERFGGDDHATGMAPGAAGQPLQGARQLQDLGGFLVATGFGGKLGRGLQGLVQRGAGLCRNQFGNAVAGHVGLAQDARGIAHHRPGGHGAKGDDLGHPVGAMALGDVLDHPVATCHAEVHVEIRQRDALWVQEPLEQ